MKAYRTEIEDCLSQTGARQRHFRLDPPLDGNEFVISSAVVAMCSGPETFIFAANDKGEITSFRELDGSYRGGLDCDEAIRNAGYEIVATGN